MHRVLSFLYTVGIIATLVYLMFVEHRHFYGGNWFIAIPINVFLSAIWPIYWLLRYFFFKGL